ncbi:MAG: hypothetical protein FJ087_08410 [Deltaproteobacteria bacterium]|nr:hypothetical protein [Deltaproteobacteria bacterium]
MGAEFNQFLFLSEPISDPSYLRPTFHDREDDIECARGCLKPGQVVPKV